MYRFTQWWDNLFKCSLYWLRRSWSIVSNSAYCGRLQCHSMLRDLQRSWYFVKFIYVAIRDCLGPDLEWALAFVCFCFFSFSFHIFFFLFTCARLSWPHSAFQFTLNSLTVLYRTNAVHRNRCHFGRCKQPVLFYCHQIVLFSVWTVSISDSLFILVIFTVRKNLVDKHSVQLLLLGYIWMVFRIYPGTQRCQISVH